MDDTTSAKSVPQPSKSNSGKVFDVVRPGRVLASPTSRPTIQGHKPLVQDDQFVAHAPSLDSKSLLKHHNPEVGISSVSATEDASNTSSDSSQPAPVVADEESLLSVGDESISSEEASSLDSNHASEPEVKDNIPSEPEPVEELTPLALPETASPDNPQTTAEVLKTSPEQLAVGQSVSVEIPPAKPAPLPDDALDELVKSSGSDDLLADTDAPTIGRPVVSSHKSQARRWQWLLALLLFIVFVVATLDILLGLGTVKTSLNIPYTKFK